MKKFLASLVATLALVVLAVPVNAQAVQSCTIGNTGPDSNNTCSFTSGQTCQVTNGTVVTIGNTNVQNATSGQAVVVQNTNGGSSNSGSSSNSNTTVTGVGVTNGDACVVTVAETPAVGGSGSGTPATPAQVTAVPKGAVAAGSVNLLSAASTLMIAAASVVAGMVAFKRAHRALSNK